MESKEIEKATSYIFEISRLDFIIENILSAERTSILLRVKKIWLHFFKKPKIKFRFDPNEEMPLNKDELLEFAAILKNKKEHYEKLLKEL